MINAKKLKYIAVISGILGILALGFYIGIMIYIKNTWEYANGGYLVLDNFYLIIYQIFGMITTVFITLCIVFIGIIKIKK